jgi:hypothetical protein
VPVEVIKEVPVEVVRTIIKVVEKEVIKEVPIEVIKEVRARTRPFLRLFGLRLRGPCSGRRPS